MLERVIIGDFPICVLNEQLAAFLGEQRPMSQELSVIIFAEFESEYSSHAT